MSFQDTLDRLKKQNLNEEGLDKDTERWKKILEHRAAEKGKNGGDQGGKAKMLWDVVIDAFNSETHPKPIRPRERSAYLKAMAEIQMELREKVYMVVENQQFSLFVAGKYSPIPPASSLSLSFRGSFSPFLPFSLSSLPRGRSRQG
jgi:hypothetical protein